MHTVDRGPEPRGLKRVRDKYTPKWVAFFPRRQGRKPSDSKWRDFHGQLSDAFEGLCGYCEREAKGEVDHFRPKSIYPERVYSWENWVFACHTCNNNKLDKWPSGGYVNPCARSAPARPESYFEFDTETGDILPRQGLTPRRLRKAQRMIDDLHLNAFYHHKARARWLRFVSLALKGREPGDAYTDNLVDFLSLRSSKFSSITRAWLAEQGYGFDDG